MVANSAEHSFTVDVCRIADIDAKRRSDWDDLLRRSLEPNAYLSANFTLNALAHFDPDTDPLLLFIRNRTTSANNLMGLAVFTERKATRHFPLTTLSNYRSKHTFLSGILVDQAHARDVLAALISYLASPKRHWSCIEFSTIYGNGPLFDTLVDAVRAQGLSPVLSSSTRRATLSMSELHDQYAQQTLGNKRFNEFKRQQRRLHEQGGVRWRAVVGHGEAIASAAARFLHLENLGWKRTAGTSLASSPNERAFFDGLCRGATEHNPIFFGELLLGDKVIASSCNLLSGRSGFAFKIGWDPDWAKFSPGMLNEVMTVESLRNTLPTVTHFDSGASEGSFIERLWGTARPIVTLRIPTRRWSRALLDAHQWFHKARDNPTGESVGIPQAP